MFRTLEAKLKIIWKVVTSKSAHIIYQKYPGTDPHAVGFGQGDLRDLVLFSTAIKNMYDEFITMVNEAALNSGELHALQQLRDAVDVIEKEAQKDGKA